VRADLQWLLTIGALIVIILVGLHYLGVIG